MNSHEAIFERALTVFIGYFTFPGVVAGHIYPYNIILNYVFIYGFDKILFFYIILVRRCERTRTQSRIRQRVQWSCSGRIYLCDTSMCTERLLQSSKIKIVI